MRFFSSPRFSAPRRALIAALTLALAGCGGWFGRVPESGPIVALLPGDGATDAYARAVRRGLNRVTKELAIPVRTLAFQADEPDAERLQALREAAASDATLVLGAGVGPDTLVLQVAADFPQQRFAVIGSQIAAANVAAYDVREAQGAWLAGAAAGLLTRSSAVGYAGGTDAARMAPLQAAFAAGLAASNPRAQLLTRTMNDAANEWAGAVRAAAAGGADVMYLAGEHVPSAAFAAAAEHKLRLIVHWRDGDQPLEPPVVAAVVADPAEAVFQAGRDLYDAMWKGAMVRHLGVESPDAVRLALPRDASTELRERMEIYRKQIATGSVKMPDAGAPATP